MKKCTYCGKEYPDVATACSLDGNLLKQIEPSVPSIVPEKDAPPPLAVPAVKTGNVFRKHPIWWLTLLIACLVYAMMFPGKVSARDILWAHVLGSVLGMFGVAFVLTGVAHVISILTRKRMTSQQFMSTFSVAILIVMVAHLVNIVHENTTPEKTSSEWEKSFDEIQKERDQALRSIELFETSVETKPAPTHGEDYVYVSRIHGRIRNRSTKTLSTLTLKISILNADKALIDTKSITLPLLAIAPGDVQSFSQETYIDRVPKTFAWRYSITAGEFY